MSQLLEHILNKDYLSANELFEERMVELQEQKLYESKRMMQAEVFGRLSPKEIEDRKKAGYRKATEVLGDPTRQKMKPLVKLKKKITKVVKEDSLDEAGLGSAVKVVRKLGPVRKAIASKLFKAKREFIKGYKKGEAGSTSDDDFAKHAARAAGSEPSHGTSPDAEVKRPGVIQRNINTLMGRQAGDTPKSASPENRGGRVGKVARRIGIGLGAALQAAQPE